MPKLKNLLINIENKITTKVFLIIFILALIFRLMLTAGMQVYFIPDTTYDDIMQISKTLSILNGEWLGEYGSLTLVKGVGYPLLTAIFSFLSIPYILAWHSVYVLASVVFIYAVYPLIKSKLSILIIYFAVLFNPIAFTIGTNKFYRDTAYYSIAFLAISFFLCFITRNDKKLYAFFAGFSLALAVLTREDSHFILVYMIAVIIAGFIIDLINKKGFKNCLIKISLVALGYIVVISPISYINYSYYKTFDLDEYQSSSFADAYGALSRLDGGLNDSRITIPYEERMKLYENSPAFNELYPLLDAQDAQFETWKEIHGEYKTGYFSFVLRDAAASLGYFETAEKSDEYFTRLANEVNEYCDNLDYEVGNERSGVHARFYLEDTPEIINSFIKGVISTSKFENISCLPIPANADDEYLKIFEDATNSTIAADRYMKTGEIVNNYSLSGFNLYMQRAIRVIIIVYQLVFPVVMIVSVLLWILDTIKVLLRKYNAEKIISWLSASSLLGVYVARMVMLAFVDATTFSTVLNPTYQAATYTVMVAFAAFQILKKVDEYFFDNKNTSLK